MPHPVSKSKPNLQHKPSRLPQFLILGGLVLLVIVVLAFKPEKTGAHTPLLESTDLPEARLDTALRAGLPTLAFFHSNTCEQCLIMIDTVNQVFPEFAEEVVLIDVNVYDEQNIALLERVGLQYIPTLIFYDRTGKEQVSVGVMDAEILRQTLAALAEGG